MLIALQRSCESVVNGDVCDVNDWNAASHPIWRVLYARQVSKALPLALPTCRDALQYITHHEPISTLSFLTTKLEARKGYTTVHTTVGGEGTTKNCLCNF